MIHEPGSQPSCAATMMRPTSKAILALLVASSSSSVPPVVAFTPSHRPAPLLVGRAAGAGCAHSRTQLQIRVSSESMASVASTSSPSPVIAIHALSMSSWEDGEGGGQAKPPRRRKRKDGRNIKAEQEAAAAAAAVEEEPAVAANAPPAAVEEPQPEPVVAAVKEDKDKVVTMNVRDVRDILSGKPEESAASRVELDYDDDDDDDDDDDELADDEEWEYYDDDEDEDEDVVVSSATRGGGGSDSLEQLLADARKMRTESSSSVGDVGGGDAEGGVFDRASIPDGIKNAISTIVTVDFFVVLGLLAWFLAGIFVRAAFGNDSVQIAFNNNFETLVQPALGVLMIASAAGAVIKDPEEDDRGLSE